LKWLVVPRAACRKIANSSIARVATVSPVAMRTKRAEASRWRASQAKLIE